MEKYTEVMKKTLELSETVEEGLIHTQKLIGDGQFEQAVYMFEEAMKGYAQLEGSVRTISAEMESEELPEQLAKVVKAANQIVETFGDQEFEIVREMLQFSMLPRFKQLRVMMESAFGRYILQ